MKKILIIGAGAMGAAFTFPCLDNNHKVTLSEPYDLKLIRKLSLKKKFHPVLKINLPKKLTIKKFSKEILNYKWDLIVVAVSSLGIDLVKKNLKNAKNKCPVLVLTKGLKYDKNSKKIITMSEQLSIGNKFTVSSLKGPCLASELARKIKSSTVIASKNIKVAQSIGKLISTSYYQVEFSKDIRGVEISSAIKNIYSMVIGSGEGLNTSSSIFRKSISEMIYLIKYLKGKEETIYGLAGIGDLYVSAIGGRNSLMGKYLGEGHLYKNAKEKFMKDITVEGAQLALEIGPKILQDLNSKHFPLMFSMLNTICENKKLEINW